MMITFDCFRNDDPPRLADLWRASDLGPAALQPMTSAALEDAVFSKPYFDRHGLIVARDKERLVGFCARRIRPGRRPRRHRHLDGHDHARCRAGPRAAT